MAVEYKYSKTLPVSIPGRKIYCCLCSETGVWAGTGLDKFATRFPDAKERYLENAKDHRLRLGHVLYCPGKDENSIAADMICRMKDTDSFGNDIHFGYLYGCFLQAALKGQLANATVIVATPGADLQEWQWRKLMPILEHAIEVTDSSVRAVVAAPFDLVAVDNDEHHTTKHKAKRSKGASKSSRNDDEQLSLF